MRLNGYLSVAFAATLAVAVPAFAGSDLPRRQKLPTPTYVGTCPSYGFGFFQIPGTPTCVKLGLNVLFEAHFDFVRNDLNIQTQRLPTVAFPNGGVPVVLYSKQNLSATANHFAPRTDVQFTVTTVTPTEFGPVVTFTDQRNAVQQTLANNRITLTSTPNLFVDQAWISWAGLTAGKHQSYFDFTTPGYGFFGGYSSLDKTQLLAYSKTFNNLFSVTASLEDPTQRQQVDGVISGVGPQRWPDLVGQLRFAPNNALFQISGALHQNIDTTANSCCAAPVHAKEGFALLAGMELRAHWSDYFGPGASGMYGRLLLSGAYANGALSYLGMPFFASDYVSDANGTIHPSHGYSAIASYEQLWTPFIKSTLTLSAYDAHSVSGFVNLPAVTPAIQQATQFAAGLFNFNYRVRGWAAQFGNEFTPANGLIFGGEVNYTHDRAIATYSNVAGNPQIVNIWSGSLYVKRLF